MTMYGALHAKSDVDRLDVKRKEGDRGLMSVERCFKEEQNILGFYIPNSEENFTRGVAPPETINNEDTVVIGEFKKQKQKTQKQNWCGKKMREQFV